MLSPSVFQLGIVFGNNSNINEHLDKKSYINLMWGGSYNYTRFLVLRKRNKIVLFF